MLAAVLGGAAALAFTYSPQRRQADARRRFEAQMTALLPVGLPEREAGERLGAAGVEHSEYLPDERRIYAIRRDTSRGLFSSGAVQATLSFDERGRLRGIRFEDVYTGP